MGRLKFDFCTALDDESVEFSKMDQPSTTGPSSSSLSTTVKGDEMCWRESWGRCILFQRRKAWPARREKGLGPRAFLPCLVLDY